jgi:hypothetical protein
VPVVAGFVVEPPSEVFAGFVSPSLELELELESDDFELFGVRVAALSFFAQPEPLKRIAGVLKPFFRVPSAPQLGQNRGPGSLIPWMTSVRCPQFEQT